MQVVRQPAIAKSQNALSSIVIALHLVLVVVQIAIALTALIIKTMMKEKVPWKLF